MKKVRRIIASILLVCVCITAIAGSNVYYADNSTQIKDAGKIVDGDNIAVSKTITPTDIENVFDITLKVDTKSEVHKMLEQPPMSVAIVLDISNTMFNNSSGSGTRFDEAMASVKEFINDYAASSLGAAVPRELSIVTFNTNAQVQQEMIDCADGSITADDICDNVETKINDLIGDKTEYNDSNTRYTNIEAGLRLAQNILAESATENKYIILLTDGMPTTYSKNHNNTSTTKITGYDPIMNNAKGTVGEDGVFYDTVTGYYCFAGVNYSDVGAKYAEERAKSIKDSGISIYSVGIDIGSQTVSDFIRDNTYGVGSTVDYNSGDTLVIENSSSNIYSSAYKNWLYNEIGSKYYADGNDTVAMNDAFADILDVMHETSKEYIIEAWTTADPMNNATSTSEYVEFMAFVDKNENYVSSLNGTAGEGNENTASYNSTTDTISWILPESGYSVTVNGNETIYTYKVTYRIRLKNEATGFTPNVPIKTNGETTLSYLVNNNGKLEVKSINYEVPQVEGYVGQFSFKKVDDSGQNIAVAGAEFTLKHYDNCEHCIEIGSIGNPPTISDMVATSDSNGLVSFSNIPSGHEYILKETSAPEGYVLDNTVYDVNVAYGEVYIDGDDASKLYQIVNEKEKYKLNYVITSTTNPREDKTDPTPLEVTDIPYGTNKSLAAWLTTTDTSNALGIPNTCTYKFSGWYDNENCDGNPIDFITITEDTTVYGKWINIPYDTGEKYVISYTVEPDPLYGIPGDSFTPVDGNVYNSGDVAGIAATSSTTWESSDGTTVSGTPGTDSGIPGQWSFTGWELSNGTPISGNVTITDNLILRGSWSFTPTPADYTLTYEILSTENPVDSVLPSPVTGLLYNDDVEVAPALTTIKLMKDGYYVNWKFEGWYDNEECTGVPVKVIYIKKDTTLYGKWTYTLRNHTVEYKVIGDPVYGTPDIITPIPAITEYNYFDTVAVANYLHTTWNYSNGYYDSSTAIDSTGVPGDWYFLGWDKTAGSNFTITRDEVITGRWSFEPETYTVDYVVDTTISPDPALTSPVPGQIADNPYKANILLADGLTTTDTTYDNGSGALTGTWRFLGWYEDAACTGDRLEAIRGITKDEVVYGKWEFISNDRYVVDYVVEPDPVYGKPLDIITPCDRNYYNYGEEVNVADNLVTTWITEDGTQSGCLGTWEFIPWDKPDTFNITENTTIKGQWKFHPLEYTLNYVIITTDNPAAEDTDATPRPITKIPTGEDVELALPLETLANNNDGAPGRWVFSGWYADETCAGATITSVNDIRENVNVYGKWTFIPVKYKVKYEVTGDGVYGVPDGSVVPVGSDGHLYRENIDVADKLTTSWTTSDGTANGLPGTWTFVSWDKEEGFEIIEDTVIHGEWVFTPDTYKVDYVVKGDATYGSPSDAGVPAGTTGYAYLDDVDVADKLSTSFTTSDGTTGGVKGVWTFTGWYDNEALTGSPVEMIEDIKEDEILYGKWEFVKNTSDEDDKDDEDKEDGDDKDKEDGDDKEDDKDKEDGDDKDKEDGDDKEDDKNSGNYGENENKPDSSPITGDSVTMTLVMMIMLCIVALIGVILSNKKKV